jgi:glycosyltransferase involved in cell wall biosynthesis
MNRPFAYSIIVCTYNRAAILRECLHAVIMEMTHTAQRGELMVIDNDSTDDTRLAVENVGESATSIVFRYVLEPVPGLARARNRGVDEARGNILVFLDDDAIVHSGWLQTCLDAFRTDPEIAAVGGEILPRSVVSFPSWFCPPLTKVYSVISLDGRLDGGPTNVNWLKERVGSPVGRFRPYPGAEHPLGANMAFARDVFANRRFSTTLGRSGADLIGSEEAEIFFRLRSDNRRVAYASDMRVDHVIAADRLTEEWVVRRYWFDGVSRARMRLGWRQRTMDAISMIAKLGWLGLTGPFHSSTYNELLWRCRVAKSLGFLSEVAYETVPRARRRSRAPLAGTVLGTGYGASRKGTSMSRLEGEPGDALH